MADGGANAPPSQSDDGGKFLLSLLHRQPHQHRHDFPPPLEHQSVALDPAVAAVGPTVSAFARPNWPSDVRDLSGTPTTSWPFSLSPPNLPPSLLGFPQYAPNPFPANRFDGNQRASVEDSYRLGFHSAANHGIQSVVRQQQEPPSQSADQLNLVFGSFSGGAGQHLSGLLNGKTGYDSKLSSGKDHEHHMRDPPSVIPNSNMDLNWSQSRQVDRDELRGGYRGRGSGGHHGNRGRNVRSTPPPGFASTRGWEKDNGSLSVENDSLRLKLSQHLDHPRPQPPPPPRSHLLSVSVSEAENSFLMLNEKAFGKEGKDRSGHISKPTREKKGDCETIDNDTEDFGEELVESLLLEDEAGDKDGKDEKKKSRNSRDKEARTDDRGQWLLSQRLRMMKRQMACRSDIHRLDAPFLDVYQSLIPAEEELVKQRQLLALLEKLVHTEWPEAKLYLYGSCANSFGFPKSDIDVCLAIEDADINKSEILLQLASILESDNLQNVQALTRARVPIVKLMDPATGISCDICINNVLAVVNTKLLRDYSQIDSRLRQLAFIVKHWAKSRKVNETYQGTLSSYAYVLMCIHFLQLRRPAILPCLQEMKPTYSVTVDNIKCAYFDEVDRLSGYGAHNRETIAQLVWGFFNYWAYGHDYANSAISVRTGGILSKREKDWTRRVGNDRHLICIEDPFETTHDLGRVVDKFSIRVIREEFERAAELMQHDPNPWVKLFEPYVRA